MQVPEAAGAIAGVVRLVIFGAVLWYVGSALLRIPPIRAFKDALLTGDTEQVTAAADEVRSWFQSFRSGTFGETTVSQPAQADSPRPTPAPESASDRDGRDVYDPGNGVTMPSPTRRVDPAYTQEAVRRKIQGAVLLTCVVRPDFTVSDIVVVRSLDTAYGLDQEAIKALEQWRFTPGRRNGRYVPVRITVEMTFTLP